jgi:hypothetical protein
MTPQPSARNCRNQSATIGATAAQPCATVARPEAQPCATPVYRTGLHGCGCGGDLPTAPLAIILGGQLLDGCQSERLGCADRFLPLTHDHFRKHRSVGPWRNCGRRYLAPGWLSGTPVSAATTPAFVGPIVGSERGMFQSPPIAPTLGGCPVRHGDHPAARSLPPFIRSGARSAGHMTGGGGGGRPRIAFAGGIACTPPLPRRCQNLPVRP